MRVLLIDDHALVRKGLEALLQSRNIEVAASVGSGQEGIDAAGKINPDVILLDINMPGMNGLETLKELRQKKIESPVLMLTMSREEADLRAALQNGAQGYLLKDMDPDELVTSLHDVLRGKTVVAPELTNVLAKVVQQGDTNGEDKSGTFAELTPREHEILCHLAEGQRQAAGRYQTDQNGRCNGLFQLHGGRHRPESV